MTSGFLRQKEERSRPKANTGMSAMETRAREYLKQKAGESRPKATKVHSGGSTIEARAYLKQKAGETREIGREYGVVPQTTSGPGLPGPYAQRAGTAGSTALPYAAAVQERVKPAVPEIKYKRGGPGPIREEAKPQLSAEEMDRIEAGQLAARLRLGEATDQDFGNYLDRLGREYGFVPKPGTQEEMLGQAQSFLRLRQPKAETFAEQREKGTDPLTRLANTVKGAAKQYAGSMGSAAATFLQSNYKNAAEYLSGGGADPELDGLVEPKAYAALIEERQRKATGAMTGWSDKMTQRGTEDLERAQQGLNPAGRLMVTAGAATGQMAADGAIGVVTGGGAMLPMLVRSFGGGAQEARQKGYSTEQQVALGLASAGIEWFSEKLFGGNPIYDSDVGLVNRLVERITRNPTVLQVLASTPVEMLNEGLEEIASDIFNPVAEWAITGTRPEYELDQIIEDGAVGVLTAMLAQGGAKVAGKMLAPLSRTGAEGWADDIRPYEGTEVMQAEKTVSQGETASTYIDTDPSTHTPEQMKRIKIYQGATDNAILAFIKKWAGLKNPDYRKKAHIPIAEVTDQAATDIKAAVGVDVSGYEHALSGGALEHIERRHGIQGLADHSMANPNDIARMGYVLENYDSIIPVLNPDGTQKVSKEYQNADHTPAPLIQFSMRIDGTYYVVEAVPVSAAHQMRVVSAYLSKDNGSTNQMLNMPLSGPQLTPKTPNGIGTSTTFIIPTLGKSVKEEFAPEVENYTEKPKPKQLPQAEKSMMTEKRSAGEKGLPTLSDTQADELLGEGTMVRFLTKRGGLKLTKDMTLSQRREALRQAMAQATSLTAEKGKAGVAQTAGSDSGLVYDDFVKQAVRSGRQVNGKTYITKETYRLLDSLAKALGVRVRFVDSVLRGKANAGINIQEDGSGGHELLIEKNNPTPLRALLGHELTHRIQQLAPEEYRTFRDYVEGEAATADSVAAKVELYRRHGLEISRESALDEVAADYAGKLFESGEALERFIRENVEHRSLLEKVRDFIRSVLDKLTGKEKQQATEAERRLTEALEAAMEQAGKLTETETTATEGGERYSLKTVDGKDVVWLESSPLTKKELNSHVAVARYIARHIGEVYTIIESGQSVYIGKDLPGEYTQSKYTSYLKKSNHSALRAKNKAVNGLGELIEIATNRRWEQTTHPQSKDAKYGMYRYDSTFAFPVKGADGSTKGVRVYEVELLIRNASDGKKYLYDIVNIKENTTAAINLLKKEARLAAYKAAPRGDASMDSISQTGEDVKGKLSLKGEEKMLRDARMPTLSDTQADELLGEGTMVRFLTKRGGLKLTKDMTLSQRREAVRKAVAQIGKG